MTTHPESRLRELLAWDSNAVYQEFVLWAESRTDGPFFFREFEQGAKVEHARTAKIVEALMECAEQLRMLQGTEHVRMCMPHPVCATSHSYECDQARMALAKLERAVEDGEV